VEQLFSEGKKNEILGKMREYEQMKGVEGGLKNEELEADYSGASQQLSHLYGEMICQERPNVLRKAFVDDNQDPVIQRIEKEFFSKF